MVSAPLSLARIARHASVAFAVALASVLAAAASAQVFVRYGEPARTGTITGALQTDRYLLLNGQKDDLLRITFSSQSSCCPTYYFHRLDVWDGATHVAAVDGVGVLNLTLPRSATYTVEVRARNGQSTGWYAFQLDRLNEPVGADRIAFGWTMENSIRAQAGFSIYTLRADAGSTAVLSLTSQSSCCPTYYYHYAELVDATGQQIAAVTGAGTSPPFTFQTTGVYTLFVAARNYQSTGWFVASVECRSWPGTPCDCTANSHNYGEGWPGTNGVPTLTATTAPKRGSTANVAVGNSAAAPAGAVLFIGIDTANLTFPQYGGTLLVAPLVTVPLMLPAAGLNVPLAIPDNPVLCGIGLTVQSIQDDPGAPPAQFAFSRGLGLLVGN